MTRPVRVRRTARARRQLAFQPLEDRTVPAFTLAIDGDATTTGVTSVFAAGTTTFTANANGAVLDVDDIETALAAGDVLITTGAGGSQAGNVNWVWDSFDDDLDYFDSAIRTLTIRPSASATVGDVTTNFVNLNFNDDVDLVIDTTAATTDGDINLSNDTRIGFSRSTTLNAGTGAITVNSGSPDPMAETGDVTLTASALQNTDGNFVVRSDQGAVTINAPIDLSAAGLGIRAELGAVTLNGPVDGANDLTVYGSTVAINAPVGGTTPLTGLTFAGGAVSYGTNAMTAATVLVGDGNVESFDAALGAGSATVTGDVTVQLDGDLAPGGAGAVGTLTIAGNLTFDGGDYAVDLGAASDQVVVSGDVSINFGRLGTETSTGALTGSADVKIVDFAGTLTGEFFNASTGSPVVVGADAIRVTNYGPAAIGLTIAQVPGAPGGKATGVEFDGTAYTLKLTGPGQLVVFSDVTNLINVVTRATTARSRVVLTTKVNASDDVVAIGPVHINGPLAAFAAPKGLLTGEFTATGPVKALSVSSAFAPIVLGGSATDKTTFKAESSFASLTTPGILSAIATTGDFGGSITAAGVGAVKIAGSLFAFAAPWAVTNGVTSLTAARVDGLDLTAKFLGTMSATGSVPKHISGDIANSVVRLTGNDGTAKRYGLKALTAKGSVTDSTLLVEEGNVGTVTVGRFFNSQLYLDYTPVGTFNTGGAFDSTAHFTLTKFTTTATTLGDPTNPLNWSFAGSQVVADTIGTVRLSGLRTDNVGDAFGFKFRTAGGSVQTKATDAGLPLNTNLTPSGSALAGDFFFLDI